MPINVDKNSGIDPNADQFRSLVGKDRQGSAFPINAMILTGIDRHWALIEGVLISWKNPGPVCQSLLWKELLLNGNKMS